MRCHTSRHTHTTTFNLPTSISRGTNTLSYEYDEAHARTVELANTSAGTQRTVYIGSQFFEAITRTAPGASTTTREYKHYIASPDGVIAVLSTTDTSTNNTGTSTGADMSNGQLKYWLKDHLGSVYGEFVAASPTTTIQRLAFDAWGQRRLTTGADGSPTNLAGFATQRGFTGHEMLDEVGLVHMNGRIYDPLLGRFMQADPIVQAPYDGQSYNRYSYVMNNPLSFTDPTGFSWWTRWRRPILAIAAAVTMQYYAMPALLTSAGITGTTATVMTGAASGFASGGIMGGNLNSALRGAFTGALSGFANAFTAAGSIERVVANATVGGISSRMSGQSFAQGFVGAGITSAIGARIPKLGGVGTALANAVVGGIGSRLAGGKFGDGAVTGVLTSAMEHLAGPDRFSERYSTNDQAVSALNEAGNDPDFDKYLMKGIRPLQNIAWLGLTTDPNGFLAQQGWGLYHQENFGVSGDGYTLVGSGSSPKGIGMDPNFDIREYQFTKPFPHHSGIEFTNLQGQMDPRFAKYNFWPGPNCQHYANSVLKGC